ncbi:cytochrome d ubiquinol oxidase subunit II [Planobispora takensis]|uniref:Putative cytochrome D ubiquinol oxydase CydB n=1 Tax=Planobispora takensis TaxID=1367882 RepID=A0A8J3T0I7_9ACTN|nr:cytochrome d ubiquinol oxidase subunit II [Planobispora takensis]GII02787.1 putative cytochrome D ubiquinol oxydase CydB [Planobispora takensis]
METIWLALLGLLLTGYFVLGGYDYGVQMLHGPLARDEHERRLALNSFGPFLLGNEVWLVAFAGVLIGAFPHFEAALLSSLFLPVSAIVGGVVLGSVAVQLRSRHTGHAARGVWGALALAGGLVAAAGWGLVTGLLLRGLPARTAGGVTFEVGLADLLDPFVLVCAATAVALFAGHGAAFIAMRTRDGLRRRAARAGRPLLAAAALGTVAAAAVGAASGLAAGGVLMTALAAALPGVLACAVYALARQAPRWAFAATSCAAALPVPIIGFGLYPNVLAVAGGEGGMTVAEAAADAATLRLLFPVAVLTIPLVLAFQAMGWWAFRGRAATYL